MVDGDDDGGVQMMSRQKVGCPGMVRYDGDDGDTNYDHNDVYNDDTDVQAEGWIAGEGEKGVESGQIAEDHIYQSA